MLRYAVVYERMPNNYGAFSPDVPGCAATAGTWLQAKRLYAQALKVYIESCAEMGEQIPEPRLSLAEAMETYAGEVASEADDAEVIEVTFGWVEIDVPDYPP